MTETFTRAEMADAVEILGSARRWTEVDHFDPNSFRPGPSSFYFARFVRAEFYPAGERYDLALVVALFLVAQLSKVDGLSTREILAAAEAVALDRELHARPPRRSTIGA